MQIVIDIQDDVIESAKTSPNYYPTYHFEKIWKAIINGTPLPKGHGKIVDIDKVLDEMRATRTYDIPFALERVKPIIEADKERSDKE